LRYYLSLTRPEYTRTAFNLKEFHATLKNDFVNTLFSWIENLNTCVQDRYHHRCPDAGEFTIEHQDFLYHLEELIKECSRSYSSHFFSPSDLITRIQRFTVLCQRLQKNRIYLEQQTYYNNIEHSSFVALELTALKYYAMVCYPIMPDFCHHLYRLLGLGDHIHWNDQIQMIVKGTKISDLTECFFDVVKK